MIVSIHSPIGRPLDAKVEVEGNIITLHSRSGGGATARNPDYRPALEYILERLADAGVRPEVYMDSQPVQHLPLERRRLATGASLTGSKEQQFNRLLRAMNEGSSSNGAYRRLRLDVPGLAGGPLVHAIRGPSALPAATIERLPYEQLRRVRAHQVVRAVDLVRRGEPHNFAGSRDFDLLTPEGDRLPPKAVFGLALQQALGIEAFPGHFSAGLGTPCFEILEEAGFEIVPKGEPSRRSTARLRTHSVEEVDQALAGMPVTEEERSWVEGNLKVAQHLRRERAAGLAKAKKKAFVLEHGKLFCERCTLDPSDKYGPAAGDACIEVHHQQTQVAAMEGGHETKLADLQCLCANCHRVLHRELALASTSSASSAALG